MWILNLVIIISFIYIVTKRKRNTYVNNENIIMKDPIKDYINGDYGKIRLFVHGNKN